MSEMTVQLSLSKVDFRGNTGDKMQFFYAFSQDTCILTKGINTLKFEFSESTSDKFKMVDFYLNSDGDKFLEKGAITPSGRNMTINKINAVDKGLIVTSVLCSYTYRKGQQKLVEYINCDPQVLNDPDIEVFIQHE